MSAVLIVTAYLFGCVNGAYYIGRAIAKEDIRTLGSANAGARNAGRIYGAKAFVMTIAVDALKTAVPISIVLFYEDAPSLIPYWVGLSVLIGHIWPIQLQFRGERVLLFILRQCLFWSLSYFCLLGSSLCLVCLLNDFLL
ncbi:Glycerol-3-phosphate 1-O-acyltransferase [Lentibacillus sp. JNUCC-1]|uniref:glycerol-3-phosphate acyltransferase n=1 Tax=Lentibacillus sp. JNUCC-1 TaxID=2654513 RepID=UPI0012E7F3D4|nr:Glycerol-3-phosphate 1-O-acyltransferase [Lentibacillus sp. JNUCC-1]